MHGSITERRAHDTRDSRTFSFRRPTVTEQIATTEWLKTEDTYECLTHYGILS